MRKLFAGLFADRDIRHRVEWTFTSLELFLLLELDSDPEITARFANVDKSVLKIIHFENLIKELRQVTPEAQKRMFKLIEKTIDWQQKRFEKTNSKYDRDLLNTYKHLLTYLRAKL